MAEGGNPTRSAAAHGPDIMRESIKSPATQGVVRPITIIFLLAGLFFALYFCFYIVPWLLRKGSKRVFSTGPLDVEDRIFTDEYDQRSSKFAFVKTPYDAFLCYSDQVAASGAHWSEWPHGNKEEKPVSLPYPGTKLARPSTVASSLKMGASGAVARPPPAYTSPLLGYFPTLITPTPIPAQPAPARRPQSQLRLSFINSRSTTSTSSSFSAMYGMYAKPQPPKSQLKPLTCVVDPKPNPNPNPNLKQQPQKGKGERPRISKPITHPDGPLPGPHIIDIAFIPQTQTQPQISSKSKPTLRSGTTTSRRVQSGAIMHPPPVLPPPSQAHLYNRDSSSLPPGLSTPTPTSPFPAPAHARSPSFINPAAPSNSRNNKYLSVDWKSTPPHPSNTSKIGLAF